MAWGLVCSAVTLLAMVMLFGFLVTRWGGWFHQLWPQPTVWYGLLLWKASAALGFLLCFAVGANTLPLLLTTPLQDFISETTEALCGDYRPPPFSFTRFVRTLSASLGHTSLRIAILLGGHAPLFLLHFLPGVGTVLWAVLGPLWTMLWLAAEYLDAPMVRSLYPFSEVQRALRIRPWLTLGLGASLYLLLWVPLLNLFFIPVATVAGTLMFRALRAANNLGPPPPERLKG
jgi:CysZ protein